MGNIPGRATNEPQNYFAIGKQSAKGTEASTFYFTKHLSGSGYDSSENVDSIREGGDGQEVGLRYRTLVKGDGALVVNHRPSVAARLWQAVLGGESVGSAAVASVARHTAFPVASLPYFTIEQAHGAIIERADDCVWSDITLTGEAGKPWALSANFMSGATLTFRDIASAMTPVREVAFPAFYPGGSYYFDGAASYGADVTKWSVKVSRSLDEVQTTSLGRDDLVVTAIDVDIDATIKVTSKDFFQKVNYSSGSSIPQLLATGSLQLTQIVQIGTITSSAVAQVNCPLVDWSDGKVNKLDPDGKTVFLDVVGSSRKGATYPIWVINDNADLSAY